MKQNILATIVLIFGFSGAYLIVTALITESVLSGIIGGGCIFVYYTLGKLIINTKIK